MDSRLLAYRDSLVLNRRSVSKRRMQSFLVIKRKIPLQPMRQLRLRFQGNAVIDVALERVEKGLHERIVIHALRPVHALNYPDLGQPPAENETGILNAAVGVEDQARFRPPRPYRPVECLERQCHIAALAKRPADNAARVTIHHHRTIAPPLANLEVSDIADPYPVAGTGIRFQRLIAEPVKELLGSRSAPVNPGAARQKAVLAHQAGYALHAHAGSVLLQGLVHARAAVGLTAGFMQLPDLLKQGAVGLVTTARASV